MRQGGELFAAEEAGDGLRVGVGNRGRDMGRFFDAVRRRFDGLLRLDDGGGRKKPR